MTCNEFMAGIGEYRGLFEKGLKKQVNFLRKPFLLTEPNWRHAPINILLSGESLLGNGKKKCCGRYRMPYSF